MVLRRREGIAGNLVLTTGLKRKLATVKGKIADVSSVSPSSLLVCQFGVPVTKVINAKGMFERDCLRRKMFKNWN